MAYPVVDPLQVQHFSELSLSSPLSADMELVHHIAGLAAEPQVYMTAFAFTTVMVGTTMLFTSRAPSLAEVGKTLVTAMLLAAALTVVSMISTLPIGIAILIPGLIASTATAMLLARVLVSLPMSWLERWLVRRSSAKTTLPHLPHNP